MAKFLFLMRPEGTVFDAMKPEDFKKLFDNFVAWSESLKTRGVLVGVERLTPDGGHVVRKKRDQVVVDGPYAEMKEVVSGLFIVEAANDGEAHRIAGECPLLDVGGAVEVRGIDSFPIRP
jgi:hypothetical protein